MPIYSANWKFIVFHEFILLNQVHQTHFRDKFANEEKRQSERENSQLNRFAIEYNLNCATIVN